MSDEMLSIGQVARLFGGTDKEIDRSTVYRWMRQGRIPQPVKIGPKLTRWRRSECQKALDKMIADSKPQETE